MTTIILTLSNEDEKILRDIIASNSEVKSLEEAIFWCIKESLIPRFSSIDKGAALASQATYLQLKRGKDGKPILKPEPAPQMLKKNDGVLVITGNSSIIDNMVTRFSKGFPLE